MNDRDETEYIPPEVVEGGPPVAEEGYICDEPGCDRVFPTLPGVSMHKIRAHRQNWSGSPKRGRNMPVGASQCSLCGKTITDARMNSHLRRVHNATTPKKRVQQTRTREMPYTPTTTSRGAPPLPTRTVTLPEITFTGGQIADDTWEERAATVRRATTEFVRLTAERADYKLNLSEFTVDDEVVILKDSSGGMWMLRRIG